MKIEINCKNINLTPDLQRTIDKNTEKMDKLQFFREEDVLHVVAREYKEKLYTVTLNILNRGDNYKCEASHEYLITATNIAFKKLINQVRKHRRTR